MFPAASRRAPVADHPCVLEQYFTYSYEYDFK